MWLEPTQRPWQTKLLDKRVKKLVMPMRQVMDEARCAAQLTKVHLVTYAAQNDVLCNAIISSMQLFDPWFMLQRGGAISPSLSLAN